MAKLKPVAVYQEKNKNGKFVGEKIYIYDGGDPKWWIKSLKPLTKLPSGDSGERWNRKQYKTIKDFDKYFAHDNIVRVNERITENALRQMIRDAIEDLAGGCEEEEIE